nr:solute carrier family 28 member 3-like [Lytechinus pictus]
MSTDNVAFTPDEEAGSSGNANGKPKSDEYNDIELKEHLPASTPRKPGFNVDDTLNNTGQSIDIPEEGKADSAGQCWTHLDGILDVVKEFYVNQKKYIHYAFGVVALILWLIYLVFACIYDVEGATTLLIITGIGFVLFLYSVLSDLFGEQFYTAAVKPVEIVSNKYWRYFKWPFFLILIAGLAVILYFLTRDNPNQLISFSGLVCFIFFSFICSKHPRHVKWRPVIWGLALQFLLGLFILRTQIGFTIFNWMGNVVQTFLGYSTAGSVFLFGDLYYQHYFAFAVLPIVIYFSSAISILYYLGVMQVVIKKIAWIMQRTMKTSASESLNAAGNIFIGQTEAPLLIRPYLPQMTRSEIHAVMTGGFATIAGSVLGAFVANGISATHLISASVMSAPAALAVSKLMYPETEVSKTVTEEDVKLPKGEERNIIEAASKGASQAVPLVLNIAANLVTFLALLAFLDGVLGYLGGRVGFADLSFQLICGYVFRPIAFIMGVPWEESQSVAELIGLKTFINEFVAYDELAKILRMRNEGAVIFTERSEVIATYALCGFANIGSIGIQLGGLTPMAPSKAKDLAAVAVRALIAGTIACFMTACIAGILFVPTGSDMVVTAATNATMNSTIATMNSTIATTIEVTTEALTAL